jgi:hypothetical protein
VEVRLEDLRHAGCEVGDWIVVPPVRRCHAQTVISGCAGGCRSSGTWASSRRATNLCSIAMVLRSRGLVPSGGH